MAPLPTLEPGGPTASFTRRLGADGTPPRSRPLNVVTHFLRGDDARALSLKVKLPPAWDDMPVSAAVVEPFIAAYDAQFPAHAASALAPFTHARVLVWGGPIPCAADRYRDEAREGAEDVRMAEQPIYGLFDVAEPVSALRARARNRLKPTVESPQ